MKVLTQTESGTIRQVFLGQPIEINRELHREYLNMASYLTNIYNSKMRALISFPNNLPTKATFLRRTDERSVFGVRFAYTMKRILKGKTLYHLHPDYFVTMRGTIQFYYCRDGKLCGIYPGTLKGYHVINRGSFCFGDYSPDYHKPVGVLLTELARLFEIVNLRSAVHKHFFSGSTLTREGKKHLLHQLCRDLMFPNRLVEADALITKLVIRKETLLEVRDAV